MNTQQNINAQRQKNIMSLLAEESNDIYLGRPELIEAWYDQQCMSREFFDNTILEWANRWTQKKNTILLYGPSNSWKTMLGEGLFGFANQGSITNKASNFKFQNCFGKRFTVWDEALFVKVELEDIHLEQYHFLKGVIYADFNS